MKKKWLTLSLGVLSLTAVTTSVILLSTHSNQHSVESSNQSYTLTMDKDHRIIPNESAENSENWKVGYVKTGEGNDIRINYSSLMNISPANKFVSMPNEDENIEFVMPLNGLRKMEYSIDRNMKIEIGYSKGEFIVDDELSSSNHEYSFEDKMSTYGVPPCYVRFTNITDYTLNIESIKLFYSCVSYPDPTKSVGEWDIDIYEGESFATIKGYHCDPEDIPENKTLIIPQMYMDTYVWRIEDGVLDNVTWCEHIVLPFIGRSLVLDTKDTPSNFASIFGKNSVSNQYKAITQFDGKQYNIYYIPKVLKTITVAKGNMVMSEPFAYFLPDYSFYGCDQSIERIVFSDGLTHVGRNAFTNCATLKEVLFTDSVTTVGDGAFLGCNYAVIRSMTPYTEISDAANPQFRPVSKGYRETISVDGITYDVCMDGSKNLYLNVIGLDDDVEVVSIPSNIPYGSFDYPVKKIANKAFENHSNLKAIHFEEDIEHVGHRVFANCYKASVYLAFNPELFPNKFASDWDTGLGGSVYIDFIAYHEDNVHYFEMTDGAYVIDMEGTSTNLDLSGFDKVVFPEYAFENDLRLHTIDLPLTVFFKGYSFSGCANLEEVRYPGTHDQLIALKNQGCFGMNCFNDSSIDAILCADNTYVTIN